MRQLIDPAEMLLMRQRRAHPEHDQAPLWADSWLAVGLLARFFITDPELFRAADHPQSFIDWFEQGIGPLLHDELRLRGLLDAPELDLQALARTCGFIRAKVRVELGTNRLGIGSEEREQKSHHLLLAALDHLGKSGWLADRPRLLEALREEAAFVAACEWTTS